MNFKPSISLTLLLLALCLVFARLGWWQLERQAEKQQLFDAFENAPQLTVAEALEGDSRFARVEARGRYDRARSLLLDNRILDGRPGVHVLTPFRLAGGGHLLVNRGWLPMPADRRSLPGFETDAAERTIRGVLRQPPAGGPRLGEADDLRADQWPQLVTYLDPDRIAEVMGLDLPPRILHLDAADSSGFAGREWQAAVMRPAVHGAYALQWFALAAAALVIWIVLGVRRGRHLARPAGRAAQGSGVYF